MSYQVLDEIKGWVIVMGFINFVFYHFWSTFTPGCLCTQAFTQNKKLRDHFGSK